MRINIMDHENATIKQISSFNATASSNFGLEIINNDNSEIKCTFIESQDQNCDITTMHVTTAQPKPLQCMA